MSFQLVDYGSYNQDLLDSVEDMVAVLDEPDQDVLFDQSDSYVAVVGPDLRFYQTPGGVWRISDRYVVETGWTKDQLGGADWRDWFDPSGSVSALGALGAAGSQVVQFSARLRTTSGNYLYPVTWFIVKASTEHARLMGR